MPQAGPSVILIPAYNEEANIQKTVELIRKTGIDSKIVVVNDGSVDRTSEIAKSLNCTVIDLQKNLARQLLLL